MKEMDLNNLRVEEGNPMKYVVVDPEYLFYYLHVQRTMVDKYPVP
jgi:sugar-specific transcriptional regulator TrmB